MIPKSNELADWRSTAIIVLVACSGCYSVPADLDVQRLQRDCGVEADSDAYEVVVQGAGFEPAVHADLACGHETLRADDEFQLTIDGSVIAETQWQSETELLAWVPLDVAEGLHEVVLEGPDSLRFEGMVLYKNICGDTETTDSTVDTATELSCADLAALDPQIVCCPDPPPTSCDPGAWDWDLDGPYDPEIGCCASATGEAVRCELDTLVEEVCDPDALCVFVDGDGSVSCALNSCIGAIPIDPSVTPSGVVWTGRFSDYEDTWQTSDTLNCNLAKYVDVWFEVQVPLGKTLAVDGLDDPSDIVIRHIGSCDQRTCIDAMDVIDYLAVPNPGPSTSLHISIVPAPVNTYDNLSVSFTLL